MADVTFITGNANKAKYFSHIIGHQVAHKSVEIHEIQSLDLREVVTHKAKAAFAELQSPVLVEDTSLVINSLGRMPGTFIKWFLDELGLEKVCRLADISDDRSAHASAAFAYYDGVRLEIFVGGMDGMIPEHPRGDEGFGWNPIFIPETSDKTMGEMTEAEFEVVYAKIKAFDAVKEFLHLLQ